MSFYSDIADAASATLADYGQTMQIGVPFSGAYDPATGTASQTFNDHAVTGAAFSFPQRDIDGTLVKAADLKVYLSVRGLDVVPTTTNRLTIGGVVHSIINVQPISPAGTVVAYVVQARR